MDDISVEIGIGKLQRILAAAESARAVARGDERPGDGLDQPACRKRAPGAAHAALALGQHGARDAGRRGMGADGTLSRPAMRTTSSTRSADPWMSGRQLGAVTFTFAPLPSMAKPSVSSVARICFSSS